MRATACNYISRQPARLVGQTWQSLLNAAWQFHCIVISTNLLHITLHYSLAVQEDSHYVCHTKQCIHPTLRRDFSSFTFKNSHVYITKHITKQNTHRNEAKHKYKRKSCKRNVICERVSTAFVFIHLFFSLHFHLLHRFVWKRLPWEVSHYRTHGKWEMISRSYVILVIFVCFEQHFWHLG